MIMGKIKNQFYKEISREAHHESHPMEEELKVSIDEYRALLKELEEKCPQSDERDFNSYLYDIDVIREILIELEEKQARNYIESIGGENCCVLYLFD